MAGPILCATDLSDRGLAPVDLATFLAKAYGSRIELIHVGDGPSSFATDPVPEEVRPAAERLRAIIRARRDEERAALDRVCERVAEHGVACSGTVRDGRPWEAIVEASTDIPAVELVVVGPHASDSEPFLSRLGTRILGSTADRVVRHARRPVVVAPSSPGEEALGSGPVVVGVDTSAGSAAAAAAGARLAGQLGRGLVLVHVLPRTTDEDGAGHEDYAAVLHAHAEREARSRLETLERNLPGTVEVRLVPVAGTPSEGLVNAAEDVGGSFLVVGTHARHGAARLVLGSTAEQVLRTASVPVMVVPPAGKGAQP